MKTTPSLPLPKFLQRAVGVALGSLLSLGALAAEDAADDAYEPVLEEVVVTGSRIQRSTRTQSQELVRVTAEDLIAAGEISVAEALRSSTLNSFGSLADQPLQKTQSNAVLDLRGVGAERNLVLLNGRRTVGSPALGGSGAVNLNLLPYAAVDRIEIIADGASAVYGSDAIAGVTNVILKKNYEGLLLQARYGDRSEDDATEKSASVVLGASGERGSLTFTLEYDRREPIYDADRDYLRPKWGDFDGDGVIMGYVEDFGVSWYGYTLVNPDWYPGIPYDPSDQSTWMLTPGAGCTEGDGFTGVISAERVLGPGAGFYCGYANGLIQSSRAGLDRLNSFVSAEYRLTDSISLFADVLIARNESFGRWAPPAWAGPPFPDDPRNDIGATYGYFRWVEIGTRDYRVADTLTDINIGARGDFGGSATWEAYYTFSDYVSVGRASGFPSYAGWAYNIYNGIEDRDQFIANIQYTPVDDSRQNLQKLFAGVQFDLFDLPGGSVSAYVGGEYFTVDYQALVDPQAEAGLIANSAGASTLGSRDVTAVFAEAVFPLFDGWEVDLALRHDEYSDYGSSATPRIGTVLWLPSLDALRFKASWGRGFRAPDLSDLFAGGEESQGSFKQDWYGCELHGIAVEDCYFIPMDVAYGSNPGLDAENSESWSVGVDWRFTERWLASVNYFHLELADRIVYPSAAEQLAADWHSGGNNPNVQRNAQGWAERVDSRAQNSYVPLDYESVDFALSGAIGTPVGELGLRAHASRYLTYEEELTYGTGETLNAVGGWDAPEWRGNLLLSWDLDDAFAALNWDYVGSQTEFISGTKLSAYSTFNVQAGYDFGRFGTFTLGANNVLNKAPEVDENGFLISYNTALYDWTGRVIFVSYRVER